MIENFWDLLAQHFPSKKRRHGGDFLLAFFPPKRPEKKKDFLPSCQALGETPMSLVTSKKNKKKKKRYYFPWNTGCLIGILMLVYHNPDLLGRISSPIYPNQPGVFSLLTCYFCFTNPNFPKKFILQCQEGEVLAHHDLILCWKIYDRMTSQPTAPKVSPQETAGLMIRAYANPLVSLDKAGSETQISDGGYVKVGGTGWPVIMPFTMRFHVQNANQVLTSKHPTKKKTSQTQVIDVQKSCIRQIIAVFFRISTVSFVCDEKIHRNVLRFAGLVPVPPMCSAKRLCHFTLHFPCRSAQHAHAELPPN